MPSTTSLVLTVIGKDRPGLVGELSAVISSHGGNWLESSMSQLAGQFAGIVRVAVPPEKVAALKAELEAMPQLRIMAETVEGEHVPLHTRHLTLSLLGHDRIGIVKEVSQVLARHGVNVEELITYTASAAMSAEMLFHAHAELLADESLDLSALKADLEQISNDLMVDLTLGEVD